MVFLGILGLIIFIPLLGFFIYLLATDEFTKLRVLGAIIFTALIIGSCGLIKFGANSASFKREIKDLKSDYAGGIHREICITAEDGREIYYYEGTVDLAIDGDQRKIKFEDENGNRQIIIYGIQDTVTIIEN